MSLVEGLRGVVGPQHVRTNNLDQYEVDWTRAFRGAAIAVVEPATTDEVADLVGVCRREGVPIVPQGGNTGLVGGGVPDPQTPGVVVRLVRLSTPAVASDDSRSLTAGAGVTLAEVQREATRVGRFYGVDLAARDQATIGGTVATNAGGVRVCAFGMTRRQLLGLEFVLGDGRVISDLVTLPKDNTGYNLSQLLCGSEGTLGIITEVVVRLLPQPGTSTVFALPVADLATALAVVDETEAGDYRLLAAEIVDAKGWRLAAQISGSRAPFDAGDGAALLMEVEDGGMADGVPSSIQEEENLVVATSPSERRRLWELREGQTEAWSRKGLVHKFDVSLPFPRIDEFVAEVRQTALGVDRVSELGFFGHLADGNLHLEVVGDHVDATELARVVLGVVSAHGGSISAEHGVGRAKAAHLLLRRSESEIETMRRIKSAVDPDWILNPGVLLPR